MSLALAQQLEQEFTWCMQGAQDAAEKAFRQSAWEQYLRLGLPGRGDEAWKYSSLAGLSRAQWAPAIPPDNHVIPAAALRLVHEYAHDFDIALLVNGRLLKSELTPESGYELEAFDPAVAAATNFSDGLAWATAATHRGGYELRVQANTRCMKPLLILNYQAGEESWCSTLNRVVIGQGAQFELAEIFFGEAGATVRADLAHAELGRDSRLTWLRLQEEAIGSSYFADVRITAESGAKLAAHQLHCGAGWARSSTRVDIVGEGAEVELTGLCLGDGDQHVDQRVEVHHLAGYSQSSQLFKSVLKDRARGVLNGKIHIHPHAQKVISSQLNHNLLLSPGAEADTKPELEIFADDVKANHGASCGRLDEEHLFYLISRGIPRAEAGQMLAKAFVADVLMKVSGLTLRSCLSGRVERRLPQYTSVLEAQI